MELFFILDKFRFRIMGGESVHTLFDPHPYKQSTILVLLSIVIIMNLYVIGILLSMVCVILRDN